MGTSTKKTGKRTVRKPGTTARPAKKATRGTAKKGKTSKRTEKAKKVARTARPPAARPRKPAARKVAKKVAKKRAKPGPALEVDPAVLEFIEAIDSFKKEHSRPFPTWSEILYILRQLGYRRP